jgi:hypothetical protein
MTPKEKAKELVDKHKILFKHYDSNPRLNEGLYKYFKKCALITVDEMIFVLPFTDTNSTLNEYAIHLQKYLEQVKHEIEKL